jgi:hypothetical protein
MRETTTTIQEVGPFVFVMDDEDATVMFMIGVWRQLGSMAVLATGPPAPVCGRFLL